MKIRIRPWWIALTFSLLLHAGLIGGVAWNLPQLLDQSESTPIVIAARLAPLAPLAPVTAPPPPGKLPVRQPRTRPAPQPEPPLAATDVAEASPPEAAADAAPPESSEAPQEETLPDEPTTAAASEADTEAAALPPLNPLPPRLDMRFQVRYGLAAGEQTLLWVNEGERYTLTSVAAATGLAGVFYSGRLVQTSRGRITARGLLPEEFWDQRGEKRSNARFDAVNGTLTLNPAKGAPRHYAYQGQLQDMLSLIFQFALTAPPVDRLQSFTVFNGKKLREYTFELRGEETLETELGTLRTLHLARVAGDEGRFEAWMAIDRYYLPVRILRSDDKGNAVELRIVSISP